MCILMEHSRIQEDLPDTPNPFVVPSKTNVKHKNKGDLIPTKSDDACECKNTFEPFLCVSFMILLWYLTRQVRDRN